MTSQDLFLVGKQTIIGVLIHINKQVGLPCKANNLNGYFTYVYQNQKALEGINPNL
jgi:hypothetical protein